MPRVPDGKRSDGEEGRDDLAEVLRRRALTEDEARQDAVERRHAAGGRTARENVADLVDPGSFVEYGRFAIAAQRGRRDLDDLIAIANERLTRGFTDDECRQYLHLERCPAA